MGARAWQLRLLRLMPRSGLTLPLAACSSTDSLDSLNPMNLFGGEKYQTKVIPDTPPKCSTTRGSPT